MARSGSFILATLVVGYQSSFRYDENKCHVGVSLVAYGRAMNASFLFAWKSLCVILHKQVVTWVQYISLYGITHHRCTSYRFDAAATTVDTRLLGWLCGRPLPVHCSSSTKHVNAHLMKEGASPRRVRRLNYRQRLDTALTIKVLTEVDDAMTCEFYCVR